MFAAAQKRWRRFLEDSSFLREYLWKYRRGISIGLLALVVVDLIDVLPPIFLKQAVDVAVDRKPAIIFLWIALGYLGVSIVQAIGRYMWRMFLIRSSLLAGRDLRARYSTHLFELSSSFFDRHRIGDLMSLATTDTEAVRMAIGAGLLTLADALFFFITVPIAMFWLSPKLTLIALAPLPLIPWYVIKNEKKIHSRFNEVQESFSRISAMAQENLNGVRVIKATAREDRQLDRFKQAGLSHIKKAMHLVQVQSAFGPTLDFMMSLSLVLLLIVGGKGVMSEAVTLGTFVAFQRYIQKMAWPMAAIGHAIVMYQRALASSVRIKGIIQIPSDVPESSAPKLPADGVARGRVEFKNLSFKYPGTDREVLSGISLTVEPGMRVAFVGTIGAGKSALLSLMPRLYPVSRGMLLIDGIDVNDWPIDELRKSVGYVSQDVFLFSETVLENVAYGLGSQWVENQERENHRVELIHDSARLASVHEDVLRLAQGYDTRLGERGLNVSGGQKQRLTIARALAKQPPILVLDDALASVDVQTEEQILASLRGRPGRNTEIIAAHRISTVSDANWIVVLENGKIAQQGTHSKLIRDRSGAYFRFYEQQRLKEDLEQYLVENFQEAAVETSS